MYYLELLMGDSIHKTYIDLHLPSNRFHLTPYLVLYSDVTYIIENQELS